MMVNKYARMMVAMINDIFGFFYDECKMKNCFCIFGFNNGSKQK